MTVDCDIVIVGAGPVGLTIALFLRQMGHSVTLFERHPHRFPTPRAVGLFHQGVRAYNALGLLETMIKNGALCDIRGKVNDVVTYVTGDGEVLARFPINAPVSKSGTAYSYGIHQPTLEEEAEKACVERGVTVHRSVEVTNVVDNGDQVEVTYEKAKNDESGASSGKITASFVLGCDGANSVVRKCADIDFIEYRPATSRWLVVDVLPKEAGSSHQFKDGKDSKQYLDWRRPRTSVPSPETRRRWEFMVLPGESTELANTHEFIWKLLEEYGCKPENAIIERKTVYSVRGCWAETFAKGRLGLAGDAAHNAPQFLGQGLNSGLRDAKSLSWRIDFALKHPDGNWQKGLEDYSCEQLGTTKVFVAAAKGIEQLLTITDEELAKERNAKMLTDPIKPPNLEKVAAPGMHLNDGKTEYPPSIEPGTLFIQGKVAKDGKEGFFDNVVGEGWMLYAGSAADLQDALSSDTQKRFAERFDGRLVHFSPADGGYKDVSGRYGDWFRENDVKAVLVRPDYYIYGTAKTTEEVDGLVKSAVDHLFS